MEAKKDVVSCEKLRVGANSRRSGDFRMGEPIRKDIPEKEGKRRELKHLSTDRKRKQP